MSSLPTDSPNRRTYLLRVWRNDANSPWQYFVRESQTERKWQFEDPYKLLALLTDCDVIDLSESSSLPSSPS